MQLCSRVTMEYFKVFEEVQNLSILQQGNALGRNSSNLDGSASFNGNLRMGKQRQNYFKDPSHWWDEKHSELHPNAPELKQEPSKVVLWIDKWNTADWIKEAPEGGFSSKKAAVGRSGRQTVSCRGYSVDVRSPKTDEFSWTASISRYIKCGQGRQALKVFTEMQQYGVKPSSHTFVAALKACSSLKDLESAKQIHAEVVKSGYELIVYVGNMLVDVYSKCGSLMDARIVFEKMPHRSVVSWNSMILGYAQLEEGDEALRLYARMQQEGVVPDDRTFVSALKAYSSLAALDEGTETASTVVNKPFLEQVRVMHLQILDSGFESDVYVGTMLVDVYAKCGSLVDARRVFEKMPCRNVVSWNAMITGYAQLGEGDMALELYTQMQREGVVPDDRTFVSALKACTSLGALAEKNEADTMRRCLDRVRAIHWDIVRNLSESDIFVSTMLVDAYAKCGGLSDARRVFEQMPHRNVVSWTAMLLGYAQMEEGEEALKLFAQMQLDGVLPNDRTFVGALKACAVIAALEEGDKSDEKFINKRCLEQVRGIHLQVQERGYQSDVYVGNILVDAYAKCGSLLDARRVFDDMPHRTGVSWTAMILGYAQMGEGESALQLYARMEEEGVVPNNWTFVAALKACGVVVGLEKGKQIHAQVSKLGLDTRDMFVATALIDMYGKCGSMVDARDVFDALPSRDVFPWSALIAGYAHQGDSETVFDLMERMLREGTQPDSITFVSVLTVCSHVGLLDKGMKYFEAMSTEYGITPSIEHYNCMIDLLGRAGEVDKAMEMLKLMPFKPHGKMWRCVLSACRKWHNVEVGRQAFEGAIGLDKNDAAAYVLMSNIYWVADMVEDAMEIGAMRVKTCAWKKAGQSWCTDTAGNAQAFVAGDRQHDGCQETYWNLQSLFVKMRKEGYVAADEDWTGEVLCAAPSEKLAVAYAFIVTPQG